MCVLRKEISLASYFKRSLRIASGEGVPFRHKCLTHKNVKKNRRVIDMGKKETYQEYRTRTQNEISEIQSQIEDEELKKLQYEHQMQRIQNFTE